jgi:predicted RNA-binding protein
MTSKLFEEKKAIIDILKKKKIIWARKLKKIDVKFAKKN